MLLFKNAGGEGALIVGALPAGALPVALDRGGTSLSSEDLAARLQRWRERGTEELAFLIGGADGLAGPVLARAEFRPRDRLPKHPPALS